MTAREIPVVLGGVREFSSENCQPNGVADPCSMYAFADQLGCPPCTHFGADLVCFNEPVFAATDGRVQFAGQDCQFYTPNHVDIVPTVGPYAGELHIYAHLSEVAPGIVEGAMVRRGQQIGVSG